MRQLQEMLGADAGAEADVLALTSAWGLSTVSEDESEVDDRKPMTEAEAAVLIAAAKLRDAQVARPTVRRADVQVQQMFCYWDAKVQFFVRRFETWNRAYARAVEAARTIAIAKAEAELAEAMEQLAAEAADEVSADELELTRQMFN